MGKKPKKLKKTSGQVKKPGKNFKIYFLLGLILLSALMLRLYQPDWYNDRQFHPDERWIVGSAVPAINNWGDKPIGLQYGSLPLYILSMYRHTVEWIHTSFFQNMDMNKAYIGGSRVVSGLVSTGTIVFIFLTAMLLFGPGVALLAAALAAFTTLDIHAAHFFTVDPFVGFFLSISIYFCAKIYKAGKLVDYILAGVFYGAAMASKSAALPFALAILAAHFFHYFSIKGTSKKDKKRRMNSWINLAWAVFATVITFFICMPWAILDYPRFMSDQNEQKRILVTGEGDVPYNRQYINTTPFFYYIQNMVFYTMGIPYGTMAFIAFYFYIIIFFKDIFKFLKSLKGEIFGNKEVVLILAWLVPYFAVVGLSFAKFNRYMVPMTPFLAIITAKLLFDIRQKISDKKIGTALMALVMGGAMFYGVAFMNVYSNPHPWIDASRFMFKNIPSMTDDGRGKQRRTKVLNEMWGDDLPVWVEGRGSETYDNIQWALQEPDSPNKIEELSTKLSATDYVVMADKRAYGTYQRLPKRYPINYFYYSNMIKDASVFGYKMIYDKVNYPSLFGINIKDDKADESFQLYDHPRVYLFQNTGHFTKEQIKQILLDGQAKVQASAPGPAGAADGHVEKGSNNPNMGGKKDAPLAVIPQLSIFFWFILIELFSFIILPLHFTVFKNLKDKGYGIAKISGLFFFAWVNWVLVSLNIIPFRQISLWVLLLAFAALSVYFTLRKRQEIAAFFKQNRLQVFTTEWFFLGTYLLFEIIKLWAPDIHNVAGQGYNGGGEPMGMAYLSSIYNDVKFPPHDPWLSGFTLNYYYWGQLMLATASKLLGYMPKLTYNLSLSLLFALCFVTAYSVVYNMTGKKRYGVFAGFMLACAGNFHTLVYILDKLVNSQGIQQFLSGVFAFQFLWDPTRIYPSPVITEMPFFSYIYGDLHAHNIVIPVTVMAAGIILSIMKSPNKTLSLVNNFGDTMPEKAVTFAALSIVLGSMLAINTWNFPPLVIFAVFSTALLGFSIYRDNAKSVLKLRSGARVQALVNFCIENFVVIIAFSAVAYIVFIPFHLNFHSPYKAALGRVSGPEQASAFQVFEYYAFFFIVIFAYMFSNWMSGYEVFAQKTGLSKIKNFNKIWGKITLAMEKTFDNTALYLKFGAAAAVVAVFLALLFLQTAFAFVFVMIVTAAWMLFKARSREEIFSLVLLFIALGIILGTELFFIADGRMNTVFKFYMVGWTFLSLAVPYLAYWFMEKYRKELKLRNIDWIFMGSAGLIMLAVQIVLAYVDSRTGSGYSKMFFIFLAFAAPAVFVVMRDRIGKAVLAGAFMFLLLPVVLYPLLGGITKIGLCSQWLSQPPRMDGTRYMGRMDQRMGSVRDFDKYDFDAINWINSNIPEIDTILEAPGENMYTGVSRISIFTGMPTLVGWGYQEGQQSGRDSEVSMRNNITAQIYGPGTPEDALKLLKDYNVKYVYIGTIERSLYNNPGKFASIGDVVYSNQGSVLYKVK
jgi:YYY domain-containing protein